MITKNNKDKYALILHNNNNLKKINRQNKYDSYLTLTMY